MGRLSRRDIIKLAGGAALVGADGMPLPGYAQGGKGLDAFDHVVVLMLENRSFDNMLGNLYGPGGGPRGQHFEGVAGRNLSNPIPPDATDANRQTVPVWSGTVMDNPNPDPGEEYPHVSTQLFGTVMPATNRHLAATDMSAPFNTPDPTPAVPPMNGFVADYINNFVRTEGRQPSYDEYSVIMQCYQPDAVPVISTLAREFAVCDHWFAEVPSQTFTNRSFMHAASASGAVINYPYAHWVHDNNAETIFERIEAAGRSWKIYFDEEDVFPLTVLIHYPRLRNFVKTNVFTMRHFLQDAQNGTLPNYAFIEPRLFLNHNDMHPPVRIAGITQRSSILAGEVLIKDVYDAIRLSNSANGSNFANTLLAITFDEHGGCYDHVPPPAAAPPDAAKPIGQFGFGFDRQGVRVPAVLISAYIESGTIIDTELSHTSLMKTLSDKWSLGHLTGRDRVATNLSAAFIRSSPRGPDQWPIVTPRTLPPGLARESDNDHPLNELQRAVVGLAVAISGDAVLKPGEIVTVLDAIRRMRKELGSQEVDAKK